MAQFSVGQTDYIQLLNQQLPAYGQVAFPATQGASADANTLDDYEEGTFTAGVSFGGGTTGQTKTIATGSYTKIGDRCMGNGYAGFSAKGSSTGAALFTGLPFTARNNDDAYAPCSVSAAALTFTGMIHAYVVKNSATISLRQISEAGSDSSLTDSNFANGTHCIVAFGYKVA